VEPSAFIFIVKLVVAVGVARVAWEVFRRQKEAHGQKVEELFRFSKGPGGDVGTSEQSFQVEEDHTNETMSSGDDGESIHENDAPPDYWEYSRSTSEQSFQVEEDHTNETMSSDDDGGSIHANDALPDYWEYSRID